MNNLRLPLYLLLAAGIVVFDQATKYWVLSNFHPYERLDLLPVFALTLVFNEGAAFSFLSDAGGWQRWLFISLSTIISIVLVAWLARLKATERMSGVALALVLGGAVGNLVDRVRYGYVVDFIDVHWEQWHWPAFNIADSAIVIGVFILLVVSFRSGSSEEAST